MSIERIQGLCIQCAAVGGQFWGGPGFLYNALDELGDEEFYLFGPWVNAERDASGKEISPVKFEGLKNERFMQWVTTQTEKFLKRNLQASEVQ